MTSSLHPFMSRFWYVTSRYAYWFLHRNAKIVLFVVCVCRSNLCVSRANYYLCIIVLYIAVMHC